MFTLPRLTVIIPFAALLAAACSPDSNAPSGPALLAHRQGGGSAAASGFAVLANAAVTCTDGNITGDVGTFQAAPTGSVTLTTCPLTGAVHVGDGAATQAFNDFLLAYIALAPTAGDCDAAHTLLSTIPASRTLAPGVYCTDAALTATDVTLTLDAGGDANAAWTFKIGTLAPGALTGTNLSVVLAGGAQACNVTWWVDAAATLTTSAFQGNILAGAGITTTGGAFNGNAYSKADVTITGTTLVGCGAAGSSPSCKVSEDRVTGGGWIRGPSGAKANFAVAGGIKHGAFWGHLEFNDHGRNGPKVKGTGVTAYTVIDAVTRHIEGTARINGQGGFTYQVDVADRGEPGRNDTFSLSLSNGYSASGTVAGGNIQLHKSHGRACKDHDGDKDDHDDGDDDGRKDHKDKNHKDHDGHDDDDGD